MDNAVTIAKIDSFDVAILQALQGHGRATINELADRVGITLIGFARGATSNAYTHPQRIRIAG